MAAPPATTSSALAHLVHRQWFIMHPSMGDGGGGDASRRYLYTPVSITQADNECRLEGDKTHEIFHFLSKKVGGHFLCGPHQAEKWGRRVPPPRPPPIYAHAESCSSCWLCFCRKGLLLGSSQSETTLTINPSQPFHRDSCDILTKNKV